jgi:hypothetical protein
MSAMRILLLVLALAVVAFIAKVALTGSVAGPTGGGDERSRPAQQLDGVRQKAKAFEGDMNRSMERAEKPAEEGAQ